MTRQLVRDPIYQQLNAALRELLAGFAPGSKFLSEREVCKRFDVSRATANKALSSLVVEGLLRFRKGVGTFVSGDVLDLDLRSLVSFTAKARSAGKKPTGRVVRLKTVSAADADQQVRDALGVAGDEPLTYIERLRLADGVPVILERRHVVARLGGSVSWTDVRGSLYELWTERRGLEIAGADETIQAVNMDADEARLLDVPVGSAGLLVVATGYVADGEPLWCEQTLYRGDAYIFRNRVGRIRAARPAVGTLVDLVDKKQEQS